MLSLLTFLFVLGWAPQVSAQFANCPTETQAWLTIEQVFELAPDMREQPSQAQIPHTFLHRRIEVHYTVGQQALLTSSLDGVGELFTDDLVYIRVWPSGKVFQHDFRNADRTAVGSIPPQDITFLFEPGVNMLELSTQDLTRPMFSTLPYYILLLGCLESASAPQPTAASPTMPTLTTTPALPTATLIPTVTDTPGAPVLLASPVIPIPTPEPLPSSLSGLPMGWLFLLALAGAAVALLFLRVGRQPQPVGEVEVYQEDAFVTTFNLRQPSQTVVTLGKQGHLRLFDTAIPDIIARFTARRNADGENETVLEVLEADGTDVTQTLVLHHEDAVSLGVASYRIRYLNYAEAAISLNEGKQYI